MSPFFHYLIVFFLTNALEGLQDYFCNVSLSFIVKQIGFSN